MVQVFKFFIQQVNKANLLKRKELEKINKYC